MIDRLDQSLRIVGIRRLRNLQHQFLRSKGILTDQREKLLLQFRIIDIDP